MFKRLKEIMANELRTVCEKCLGTLRISMRRNYLKSEQLLVGGEEPNGNSRVTKYNNNNHKKLDELNRRYQQEEKRISEIENISIYITPSKK